MRTYDRLEVALSNWPALILTCVLLPLSGVVCASTKIQTMQQKDGSYSFFIHGKVADIELAKAAIKTAFTAVVC